MKLLAILLLASVPLPLGPIRTPVDLIELNTVIEPDGTPKFQQVILWERLPATGKYVVRDWYMLSDRESDLKRPYRTPGGLYETYVNDGKLRSQAYSDAFIETKTTYDPERVNQKVLDIRHRLAVPKGK